MTLAPPVMTRQPPIQVTLDTSHEGSWRLSVRPPFVGRMGRSTWYDIAMFRGAPVQLGSMSFRDPFGPQAFSFTVPAVTIFDELGAGDLAWATRDAPIALTWIPDPASPLPTDYPHGWGHYTPHSAGHSAELALANHIPNLSWVGTVSSFARSSEGLAVTCKGGLLQLDDYLAKPEYPARPIPYERAIARQFAGKPHLRTGPLKIAWPAWWKKTYTPPGKKTPRQLVPAGVRPHAFWTGMLTRETGHWDAVLSSYIQGLLSSMYTARGRFTLDLLSDGPVLLHRDMYTTPPPHGVVIDPTLPGFELNVTEDFSQSLGVVYASGISLSGETYSGMEVTADGSGTYYIPAAARRELDPVSDNEWLDTSRIRREVMLQMQQGLDAGDAATVARDHLRRFGDPGVTGTVKITGDVHINGQRLNALLVRAGMTVVIPGVLGRGLVALVTENTVDFKDRSNTLTIDTQYRDALTVREVRMRGRDALQVPRMLVAGQYNPPIPDQLVPWSYPHGSGFLPSGPDFSSVPLFSGMPDDMVFPWEPWTRRRPPGHHRWRNCYMRVGPASAVADNNWAYHGGGGLFGRLGFPVRAAQVATIRLIELAAYDADGNVMAVPFHFSLYTVRGVSVGSMPRIQAYQGDSSLADYYPYHPPAPFLTGQHYPFMKDAWEQYRSDGTLNNPSIPQPAVSNGIVRVWGTYFEKAGYYPGSSSHGDAPTGLLRDETQFGIDTTQLGAKTFSPYSKHNNDTNPLAGMIYAMIYCDAQGDQPVYFAGRMYRLEPGQGS